MSDQVDGSVADRFRTLPEVEPSSKSGGWTGVADRLPVAAAALLVLLAILKQLWTPTSAMGETFDWFTYVPMHLFAVWGLGRAAQSCRPLSRARLAWRSFQLSEGLTGSMVALQGVLRALNLPVSKWGTAVGIASYAAFVAGVLLYPAPSQRERERLRSQWSAPLLCLVACWLIWLYVRHATGAQPSGGFAHLIEDSWACLSDLGTMSAMIWVLSRGTPSVNNSAFYLVVTSHIVVAGTDLITTQMSLAGNYGLTTPVDANWYVGSFLFGLAGAYQMLMLQQDASDDEEQIRRLARLRRLAYGALVLALGILLWAAVPQLGPSGSGYFFGAFSVAGLLVVLPAFAFRDAEQALRERQLQELRFSALLEQTSDLLLVVDSGGGILYASPSTAALIGVARDQLIGRDMTEWLLPSDRSAVLKQISRAGHTPNETPHRWRLMRRDGEFADLDVLLRDRRSEALIEGIIVNARDVTRLVAIETQAREAQKLEALGRMAGSIAHEFNNLLAVIESAASSAARAEGVESLAERELGEIRRAIDRGASITGRLLAFGRRRPPEIKPLDLVQVVGGMRLMLQRLIFKEATLEWRLSEEPLWVDADLSSLEQIVLNLVLNARDAVAPTGRIEIRVEPDAATRSAILTVTDDGMGIPPDVRGRIFEPFFTTKAVGRGSGLGLSTVAKMVDELGGSIAVESALGRGAAFRIRLPLRGSDRASSVSSEAAPATNVAGLRVRGGTERILVVDDEPEIRSGLARYLKLLGYAVEEAEHGKDALRVIERIGHVDLLITDLSMPEMNGPELIRQVRYALPELKIIGISGYATDERLGQEWLENLPFLQKPFRHSTLAEMVRSVLGPKA